MQKSAICITSYRLYNQDMAKNRLKSVQKSVSEQFSNAGKNVQKKVSVGPKKCQKKWKKNLPQTLFL